MLVKKSANRDWILTVYPGIERSLFRPLMASVPLNGGPKIRKSCLS